jgi:hypothetical protein
MSGGIELDGSGRCCATLGRHEEFERTPLPKHPALCGATVLQGRKGHIRPGRALRRLHLNLAPENNLRRFALEGTQGQRT